MITYLIQVTICWAVFYGTYHLFLRQETHFSFSRWYLLAALTLGVSIPIVDWTNYFIHEPESLGHLYITPFNTQMAYWDMTVTAEPSTINWYKILMWAYASGCMVFCLRLIHSWARIYAIRRNSDQVDRGSYTLILTRLHHLPFSFLGSVYCSESMYRESSDVEQILAHEEFHIKARHSFDILFLELLKIVFWFHPLVYLYKFEIQQVHEYQADHAAYQLSTKKQYGQLLLSQVEAAVPMALSNQFFNSQLKNRFKMMTKKSSTRHSVWKYGVLFPMVAFTILLFSYSSHGKSLIDQVIIGQDTIMPPPPPPAPPAPSAPPAPPTPPEVNKVVVVGYQGTTSTEEGVPPPPPPPPPAPPADQILNSGTSNAGPQEVFRVVEEMPRFPGCEDLDGDSRAKKACADRKMLEFLYTHVRYPSNARMNGVEGNVVVQFIVEKDGSITNAKVLRDPGGTLGEEALRVVHMMTAEGKWIPGRQRGQNVRVSFILPIKFELDKSKSREAAIRSHSGEEPGNGVQADPIFILDGRILGRINNENLNSTVQPEDIESINVLKGDKAVEKYGKMGADGVIEIFTKWGKNQKESNLHLEDVRIYPVPVSNQLNIQSTVRTNGEYRLEIRDLKGQVTTQHQIEVQDGMIDATMDIDGLHAGAYYLVIRHGGKIFSRAFVKQ